MEFICFHNFRSWQKMFAGNGLWGHNHLDMENYKVPFIYCGIGADPGFTGKMKALGVATHYDLGNYLAELFGFEIINPEQEKGVYYLNGVGFRLWQKRIYEF